MFILEIKKCYALWHNVDIMLNDIMCSLLDLIVM